MIVAGRLYLEQTPFSNHLPVKCQGCAKSSRPCIHGNCNFCRDLGFPEEVFCDLNRSVQDPASLECHAFQPILKLVGSSRQTALTLPENPQDQNPQNAFQKLLDSDKIKYQRVLALQKIARDPDSVVMETKYHFAWNA